MLSSADDGAHSVELALRHAADAVLHAIAAVPAADDDAAAPVVLIDGRSGSGKTTLAAMIAARWHGPVQVVALDDLYPGWDGLRQGADVVRDLVLSPHAAGDRAQWQRWDWNAGRYDVVDAADPRTALIVEGSGVLTAASASLATVTVWLESPEASRRKRALDRDGDTYRPHWARWAAQEDAHLGDDLPQTHASIVVNIP